MYVKLPPRDLNLDPYSPHPTSTYTCGVTIALTLLNYNWPNTYTFIYGYKVICFKSWNTITRSKSKLSVTNYNYKKMSLIITQLIDSSWSSQEIQSSNSLSPNYQHVCVCVYIYIYLFIYKCLYRNLNKKKKKLWEFVKA